MHEAECPLPAPDTAWRWTGLILWRWRLETLTRPDGLAKPVWLQERAAPTLQEASDAVLRDVMLAAAMARCKEPKLCYNLF